MSRVLVQGGFSVYIYENDHSPPHVHVFQGSKPGPEVEIDLDRMNVAANYMKASDAKRAYKLVRENREFLLAEWERIDPKLNQL
jgi:hypothetical protein